MSAQLINPHRYKKVTKNQADKNKKKKLQKKYSTAISKKNNIKYNKEKLKDIKENKKYIKDNKSNKTNNKKKRQFFIPKTLVIAVAIFALVIVGFLSKKIINIENFDILNVFSNKDDDRNLVKDYEFKIGLSKLDTTDTMISNNVILNELFLKSTVQLISVNNDYSIEYLCAASVEKQNNKEYILELRPEYGININDIKDSINNIQNAGTKNIYYKQISNILSVDEFGNDKIKFMLKSEDAFFVYKLNFPIFKQGSNMSLYNISNKTSNSLLFERNKSSSTLKNISLSNYANTDEMVSDFRNDKIDMFFSSTDSVMQLIGKHDYNVKKYRDGETVFLFGNKNSKLFKQKEVRQALVYSMNRDEIVKNTNNSFGEVIDLPFIYSGVMFKYDIYGANNVLLSNGWNKNGGIYSKKLDGVNTNLELKLIVNEGDITKLSIADKIKESVISAGININVVKLNENKLKEALANGDYDIALSTVYINESPDITFIEDYLNINDETNKAIQNVKNSSIDKIAENILNLEYSLSNEVACIGIMARNVNIVYQKYITGFENTNYMKVFNNLEYIGKNIEK